MAVIIVSDDGTTKAYGSLQIGQGLWACDLGDGVVDIRVYSSLASTLASSLASSAASSRASSAGSSAGSSQASSLASAAGSSRASSRASSAASEGASSRASSGASSPLWSTDASSLASSEASSRASSLASSRASSRASSYASSGASSDAGSSHWSKLASSRASSLASSRASSRASSLASSRASSLASSRASSAASSLASSAASSAAVACEDSVSDDFNRANEDPLASPWALTQNLGSDDTELLNNEAVLISSSGWVRTFATNMTALCSVDMQAQVTTNFADGVVAGAGVCVRSNGTDTLYSIWAHNTGGTTGTLYVMKVIAGARTVLGSSAGHAWGDQTIKGSANGTTIKGYLPAGTERVSVTNSDITTGVYAGMIHTTYEPHSYTDVAITEWSADTI